MNFGLMTAFREYASRLRFPRLFMLTAALFVVDLLVPDVVPFADEIMLGLLTALLASFKRRRDERPPSGGG